MYLGLQLADLYQLLVHEDAPTTNYDHSEHPISSSSSSLIDPHEDKKDAPIMDDPSSGSYQRTTVRLSLGNSSNRILEKIPETKFHQYIKFVNRDWECKQVVEAFKEVYTIYRQRIVEKQRAASYDAYKRMYRIIVCGGAPGVGQDNIP